MPEILKNSRGELDYSKLFLALASSLILVIQALQSWHIAEIKAQGEVNKVNFLSKEKVLKIESDIVARLVKVEECCRERK